MIEFKLQHSHIWDDCIETAHLYQIWYGHIFKLPSITMHIWYKYIRPELEPSVFNPFLLLLCHDTLYKF